MVDSSNSKTGQVIEGKLLPASPVRSPKLRLGTIREVRRELVKVYEMAKTGVLPTQDAGRLTYMLQALAGMIRDSDLEERIKKLEQQHVKKS
ncbi:hypothetical protein SAMN05216326_12932 [Nitrosomonas marina]|uniref:Uncharacterized protein n=1 Tax=Nitrosomonas marina TaxID=917 RepID=A0A1I0ENZ0_9PROT|nr:hypothetical protein SAMN05216326_12932 [Nitrosomonas marina]